MRGRLALVSLPSETHPKLGRAHNLNLLDEDLRDQERLETRELNRAIEELNEQIASLALARKLVVPFVTEGGVRGLATAALEAAAAILVASVNLNNELAGAREKVRSAADRLAATIRRRKALREEIDQREAVLIWRARNGIP